MAINMSFLVAVAMAIFAESAIASTIPEMVGTERVRSLQVGLFDASYDQSVADRLSLGITAMFTGFDVAAAVRATGTVLTTPHDLAMGWTLSLGASQTTGVGIRVPFGVPVPIETSAWIQPALNVRVPFLFQTRVRATLAPSIGLAGSLVNAQERYFWTTSTPVGWVVLGVAPALELAIPLGDRNEVTLGGNGLLGWRGRF